MTLIDTLREEDRLRRPPLIPGLTFTLTKADQTNEEASLVDIDDELAFAEYLVTKHLQDDTTMAVNLRTIKVRLKERQEEKRLFLGVIGEFSSGKTTLVNALIRRCIFRMDILQGTTAAATIITYGPSLKVDVRKRQKNIAVRTIQGAVNGIRALWDHFSGNHVEPTQQDLLSIIHQATSDELYAKDIVQVNVSMPSDALKNGLVIVDTPGMNASNPRHGAVTVAALRDLCDAALVVVPAEAAGSESLFEFLKSYAADVVHRCVFVVSKIDLIRREKERHSVIDNLKIRISNTLGIRNPRVVACAPYFVVESLDPDNAVNSDYTKEEFTYWQHNFECMETELRNLLLKKRADAQVDDLTKLIVQLLNALRSSLQSRLLGYQQRHDALSQLVIPNIDQFIDERVGRHCANCRSTIEGTGSRIGGEAASIINAGMRSLFTAIDSVKNRSELRNCVESTIPSLYSRTQSKLQKLFRKSIDQQISIGHAEFKAFHTDFQNHFRNLATLGGKLHVSDTASLGPSHRMLTSDTPINQLIAKDMKAFDEEQTRGTMGMAGGGAIIGTILLPGIGTVLGGIVGGVLSFMFGPSLDELKSQCWAKLEPAVSEGLDDSFSDLGHALEDHIDTVVEQLGKSIRAYKPRYEQLVQRMRERDAEELRMLENYQASIQSDISVVESRQHRLESARAHLRDQ